MEFTLLGAAFVAVVGVYAMLWWEARRGNAVECSKDLWDVALGAIVAGVAVGRLAAMIGDGVNPVANPADIFLVRAGVATGPAAVAALAWVAWVGRRELAAVSDGLAAAALSGLAGWHAGCLVRDACLGTPSRLPWAWAQSGSAVTRHPVELYAAVVLLGAGLALAAVRMGRVPRGAAAGIALATAGGVRLATEPLRPSLSGGPVGWYVAAVAAGLVIAVIAARRAAAPS